MLVWSDAVCGDHHKLDGVCLRVLFAGEERVDFSGQHVFVLLVNRELVLAEFHLAKIIGAFSVPFQHEVYLRGAAIRCRTVPAIVPIDGGDAQLFLYLGEMLYAEELESVACPRVERGRALKTSPISGCCAFPEYEVQVKQGKNFFLKKSAVFNFFFENG
jgi:hypothetical protein